MEYAWAVAVTSLIWGFIGVLAGFIDDDRSVVVFGGIQVLVGLLMAAALLFMHVGSVYLK